MRLLDIFNAEIDQDFSHYKLIVADEFFDTAMDDDFKLDLRSFRIPPPFLDFFIEGRNKQNGALCGIEIFSVEEYAELYSIYTLASKNNINARINKDAAWVYVMGFNIWVKAYTNFTLQAIPGNVVINIDGDGKVLLCEYNGEPVVTGFLYSNAHLKNAMDILRETDPQSVRGSYLEQISINFANFAIYTLALLNCRNIEMVHNPLTRNQRRRNERNKGKTIHDFYTLKLKPTRKQYETDDQSSDNQHKNRLHIMRGHFKTYTDESPLLGKFTGTYYWNSAIRGNAEKGTIKKDYRLLRE